MKIDFSDISIISHVRVDNPDRLKNFRIRNEFYRKYCDNLEMIHVEDDVKTKCNPNPVDKYMLTNNSGIYNKNASYNKGVELSDRKYYLFLDVDCVISPNVVKLMADQFGGDSVIYPYKKVLYSTKAFAQHFAQTMSTQSLVGCKPKCGRVFMDSCGGAILLSREMFVKTGGFNPNFTGWGYEDTEYRDRCKKMETRIVRPSDDITMLHLFHGEHSFNRSKQTRSLQYKQNKRELDKVRGMTPEQCVNHMKGWDIYED